MRNEWLPLGVPSSVCLSLVVHYAITKKSASWKFLLLCTNEARNDCPCCLRRKHQPLCDASQAECVWVALDDRA